MSESDGIHESVNGAMRSALMVAGQVGQQAAQAVTQQLAERQRVSEERARELQARYDAERAAARAQTAVVHRPEWWDRASTEQVAEVWKTATAWRGEDVDVDRAARVMATEVRQRHGVDVDQLAEQQQAVRLAEVRAAAKDRSDYDLARDWLARTDPGQLREHDRENLGTERAARGDKVREELVALWREKAGAEADQLRAEAREDDRTASAVLAEPYEGAAQQHDVERDADALYDSADRRQALADRLDRAGVSEDAKEARMLARDARGVPAATAVASKSKSGKARPARTTARQRDHGVAR